MLRTAVAATLALLVLLPGDAPADDEEGERAGLRARIAEMEATIRELQAEIRRLRNRVQVLEGGEEQATSGKKDEPAIPGNEYDGWVVVPLLVRPKAAFERITREDLYNPKQRRFMTVKLKPSDVPAACVTNVRNLLGRVLRNDKRPVEFFLESELFALGTRPGPAAGVPSGRVGLWIPEEAVSGIPHLVRYAEFDLLDPRRDPDGRARARAVVEGGLIVQPGGVDDRGVFIAVTSDEAKALATALADAIKLKLVERSGQLGR